MLDKKLSVHMSAVRSYRERLTVLQGVWDNLSLLSQMSGDGVNMQTTRGAFEQLSGALLESLTVEIQKKAVLALQGKAQIAIDVLVRNLFERTADIGFLCADQDVQQFLLSYHAEQRPTKAGSDFGPSASQRQPLLRRLAEYVAKYSVYENIVLLAPDGEVLLQLNGEPAVSRCMDALVAETVKTNAGYVETFRKIDLFPQHEQSLVYSYRITAGNQLLGVLCLCFRFADESQAIFNKLLDAQDWTVLTYLDAAGRVIASSDRWQIPVGADFEPQGKQGGILRFAGREYLAVTCAANSYQGYGGPGWSCHALIPIEQVCNSETAATTSLQPAVLAAVRKNAAVFSRELQQVPIQAESIQRQLNRTVWNGHIRIGNHSSTNSAFSKVLLREISHTGRKTQEVFEHSIADLQQTVVSTILQDSMAMAALSVDILDRNLYERANDCRWWALDRTVSRCLAKVSGDASNITAVLQHINRLYTVYHSLVVFDTEQRVVAVSNQSCESLVGATIGEDWARATLGLTNSQSYHVSRFEPSPFYEGKPTLIYSAAVRSDNGRVVGGIGVVFDTEPQLQAMLSDVLMGIRDGSMAVFATRDGRVLSSTGGHEPGKHLSIDPSLLSPPADGSVRVTAIDGVYYAVGAHLTAGYREYPGLDAVALVMIPLGNVEEQVAGVRTVRSNTQSFRATGASNLELATFWVGDQWLAVPLSDVIEAVDTRELHALPNKVRGQAGYVMYAGNAVLVADLAALMDRETYATKDEIILVRVGSKTLGLLVECLDDIAQIDAGDIVKSLDMFSDRGLTEGVVRSQGSEGPLLLILSPQRVATVLNPQAALTAKQAS